MQNRLALSLLSGLLMGVSLPMQWGHWVPPNLGFLAWIALVPMILAVAGLRPGRAYLIALPGMLLAHGIMVYWFYTAVHVFGHLGAVTSALVTFLGILFLAAISAMAPCLVAWINRRQNHWWAWPLVWAALEYGRNFDPFLQGFTFCNLIHSQYQYPLLFQIVNVIGPYWFLAVIVVVNVLLLRKKWILVLLIFALLSGYGGYSRVQSHAQSRYSPWLRVALLQGNIPQEEKWDSALARQNFETYQDASREVMSSRPDLIIWPEASFPWVYDLTGKKMPDGHQLPQVPMIMGSIAREGGVFHNSAILLDSNHQFSDVVHKFHLVPFGEYIPYKKLLFFAKQLTRQVGDLQPAAALRPLQLQGLPLGMLVCYEDTFPEIARALVQQGSVLLINITNDAWYGWSSAATQHLAASVFRAAENGRYLVRATNTGISAVVGPDGGVRMHSALYEKALMVAQVGLLTQRTLYNRYGFGMDLFLPLILGVLLTHAAFKTTPRNPLI